MLIDTQLRGLLTRLRSSILMALGPRGKGVLIHRKSPREMFITKSGAKILETFSGSHPLLDIVISSVKELRKVNGEGSKRTFLAVERMLELLSSLEMTRQELVSLVQSGLQSLSEISQEKETVSCECELSSLLRSVSTSLRSSLSSRLPGPVSAQLSQLTVNLVRLTTERASSAAEWRERLEVVVTSLPSLVTLLYNRPVSDSDLGEGILLQGSLSLPSSKLSFTHPTSARISLIVLSHDKRGETEVTVQLCGAEATHIRHFQRDTLTRQTLARLREAGVDLVISSVGLAPALRQALRAEDIAGVEHVGVEEARTLCRVLGLTPWDYRDQTVPAST